MEAYDFLHEWMKPLIKGANTNTKFMKIACSHRFCEEAPCSHRVRKKKNQQLSIARKLLIFSVDQVGLESTTSRL